MVTTNPFAALDDLSEQRERRRSPKSSRNPVTTFGPYDRRLTSNRRVSVTALVPAEVDLLSLRESISGVVLSTDITRGIAIHVRTTGNRREVWLRGKTQRSVVKRKFTAGIIQRSSRSISIPLDVYKRLLPNQGFELELVPRGSRRSPW